jgi:uncharacterized tellurite resistance protein B-like protein
MENQMDIPLHWDERHVICGLYYMVADSDFSIKKEEVDTIDRHLETLMLQFPHLLTSNKFAIANEVMPHVIGRSDREKMDLIKQWAAKFPLSRDQFIDMQQALEHIAQSDDYVSIEEHSLMYFIRLKFKSFASTYLVN